MSATTRATKISCGNVGDTRSRVKPMQASLPNSLFVKQVLSWTRQALSQAYKIYWSFGCGSYYHQAHSRMFGKNKHGFQVSNVWSKKYPTQRPRCSSSLFHLTTWLPQILCGQWNSIIIALCFSSKWLKPPSTQIYTCYRNISLSVPRKKKLARNSRRRSTNWRETMATSCNKKKKLFKEKVAPELLIEDEMIDLKIKHHNISTYINL